MSSKTSRASRTVAVSGIRIVVTHSLPESATPAESSRPGVKPYLASANSSSSSSPFVCRALKSPFHRKYTCPCVASHLIPSVSREVGRLEPLGLSISTQSPCGSPPSTSSLPSRSPQRSLCPHWRPTSTASQWDPRASPSTRAPSLRRWAIRCSLCSIPRCVAHGRRFVLQCCCSAYRATQASS